MISRGGRFGVSPLWTSTSPLRFSLLRAAATGMPSTSSCLPSPSKSYGVAMRFGVAGGGSSSAPRPTIANAVATAATTAVPASAQRRRLRRWGDGNTCVGESAVAICASWVPAVASSSTGGGSGAGGVIAAARRQYGPSPATAISSSASHASVADAGRFDGALLSSHSTHSRTRGGTSGATSASGGGGSCTWQ